MYVHPPAEAPRRPSATPGTARARHAALLARLAWERADGISRAELGRAAGLSVSTVSTIVADLLAAGLLVPSHVAPSRSGRPPVVLRFDVRRDHIVGVELGASHVSVVLCDLRGAPSWHEARRWDVPGDPVGATALVFELVEAARRQPGASGGLLGVGLAVPCPVDDLAPDRLSSRLFPAWSEVRLAATLHRRFATRVFVDNDANCGALAESALGAGRGVADFTYIKVATGVGAGHIVGGRPFRGYSGIAGEIGHTTVDPGGRPCRCGLRGCLEAEIGARALVAKAREALVRSPASALVDCEPLTDGAIVDAALAGDEVARSIVAGAGAALGTAVANLLNLMNPARVVIGGRLARAGDLLLEPLRRTVRNRALWTSVERADVVLSPLGEEQAAAGAATLVLRAALADLRLFRTDVAAAAPARVRRHGRRGGVSDTSGGRLPAASSHAGAG